jgi:hypothetical protein
MKVITAVVAAVFMTAFAPPAAAQPSPEQRGVQSRPNAGASVQQQGRRGTDGEGERPSRRDGVRDGKAQEKAPASAGATRSDRARRARGEERGIWPRDDERRRWIERRD